ncbi:unnamed protein product [Lactuca saligna]|uniref:Uncharacterized protein n=1 Tax=Lactuca saligna TaxID=75948 RepID=A0AA35ZJK0_LACSI|nr:unnamed protein product [Lactuca saligna]
MTEKVDKLIYDAQVFMEIFQQSFDSNTAASNEVISSLSTSLNSERAKFQDICNGLKDDYDKFQSSITSQLSKLKGDLEMERKVMDALAIKTEKVKTLSVKLEQFEKQVQDLLLEKAVIKSCITDVTVFLSYLIEARDLIIPITMRKYLSENIRPTFTILHRLEGVPESSSILKKVGDQIQPTSEKPKPAVKRMPILKSETKPKDKDKLFSDDPIIDNEEEEDLDEAERK